MEYSVPIDNLIAMVTITELLKFPTLNRIWHGNILCLTKMVSKDFSILDGSAGTAVGMNAPSSTINEAGFNIMGVQSHR